VGSAHRGGNARRTAGEPDTATGPCPGRIGGAIRARLPGRRDHGWGVARPAGSESPGDPARGASVVGAQSCFLGVPTALVARRGTAWPRRGGSSDAGRNCGRRPRFRPRVARTRRRAVAHRGPGIGEVPLLVAATATPAGMHLLRGSRHRHCGAGCHSGPSRRRSGAERGPQSPVVLQRRRHREGRPLLSRGCASTTCWRPPGGTCAPLRRRRGRSAVQPERAVLQPQEALLDVVEHLACGLRREFLQRRWLRRRIGGVHGGLSRMVVVRHPPARRPWPPRG
jgi:hypothetical protein